MFKNEKGFTLIEILTVIAIIGILIVILVPNMDGMTQGTNIKVVETDLRTMKTGIQQHYIDNREAPFTEKEVAEYLDFEFVDASESTDTIIKLKTKLKKDPWGNSYYLHINNNGNRYAILQSYGPDGKNSVVGNEFGDDIVFIYYPKS